MGLSREAIAENYRDTAVKQVKRHLILEKIIDQENLTLTDEEVETGLQEIADAFQQPVEQIKSFYSQNTEKPTISSRPYLKKEPLNLLLIVAKSRKSSRPSRPSDQTEQAS